MLRNAVCLIASTILMSSCTFPFGKTRWVTVALANPSITPYAFQFSGDIPGGAKADVWLEKTGGGIDPILNDASPNQGIFYIERKRLEQSKDKKLYFEAKYEVTNLPGLPCFVSYDGKDLSLTLYAVTETGTLVKTNGYVWIRQQKIRDGKSTDLSGDCPQIPIANSVNEERTKEKYESDPKNYYARSVNEYKSSWQLFP